MTDKLEFIDSNILVYLVDKYPTKKTKAEYLLMPNLIISTQVIAENVNVCLKKLNFTKEESFAHGKTLIDKLTVVQIKISTVESAFILSKKYQLGWWDSLIVATAIENNCETLYSEDMQDGLVIEKTLTIVNPFL
jgi:predicted nucleic acid-binding protein